MIGPFWCQAKKKWIRFEVDGKLIKVQSSRQSEEMSNYSLPWSDDDDLGSWDVIELRGSQVLKKYSLQIKDGILYSTEWLKAKLAQTLLVSSYNEQEKLELSAIGKNIQPFANYKSSDQDYEQYTIPHQPATYLVFSRDELLEYGSSFNPNYLREFYIGILNFFQKTFVIPLNENLKEILVQLNKANQDMLPTNLNKTYKIKSDNKEKLFTSFIDDFIEEFDAKMLSQNIDAFYSKAQISGNIIDDQTLALDDQTLPLNDAQSQQLKKNFVLAIFAGLAQKLKKQPIVIQNNSYESKIVIEAKPESVLPEPVGNKPKSKKGSFEAQGIFAKDKLCQLKSVVDKAQKDYSDWYNKVKELRGKRGYFSFLRHWESGQTNARNFQTKIDGMTDYTEARKAVFEHLQKDKTNFNRHSFASFLIDELQGIEGFFDKKPEVDEDNRYEKNMFKI